MVVQEKPAQVIIGEHDADDQVISESTIFAAENRLKVGALLFGRVRVRGHQRRIVQILAEASTLDPAKLAEVFEWSAPTTDFSRASIAERRAALVAAAASADHACAPVIEREFDRFAAARRGAAAPRYEDFPVSWAEAILLDDVRVIGDAAQGVRLREMFSTQGYFQEDRFSILLPDFARLDWRDVLQLRNHDQLTIFREFAKSRIAADADPEMIKDAMNEAFVRLAEFARPNPVGGIMRLLGQIPTGIPNPLGVARDAYSTARDHKLKADGGHIFFILDARKRSSVGNPDDPEVGRAARKLAGWALG